MTPTNWFRGDENQHLVSLMTKHLQQPQPSPETKPRVNFVVSLQHPSLLIAHSLQMGCLPTTSVGISAQNQLQVFVMTQITQQDLDELQEIAAGFSELHTKKNRTTFCKPKGDFCTLYFPGLKKLDQKLVLTKVNHMK